MGLERVHSESAADHRLGDVPHRNPPRRDPPLGPAVGMPVQHQIAACRVDSLRQEVAAEERVNLRRLAVQRVTHRLVVEERNANVGREPLET